MKKSALFAVTLLLTQSVSVQNLSAQSVYEQEMDDILSNVSEFKSQDKLQQLVPSMDDENIEKKAIREQDSPSILGRSDHIFPKSKVSDEINPIFKGSTFSVEESKKRSKAMDFSPAISKSKGTTDQFKNNKTFKTNELPEVTVPPELQQFFDQQKKP